jgi:hypothetical protein
VGGGRHSSRHRQRGDRAKLAPLGDAAEIDLLAAALVRCACARAQLSLRETLTPDLPSPPDTPHCSWDEFTAGFTVGALSGVAWAYACTQFLPYYS